MHWALGGHSDDGRGLEASMAALNIIMDDETPSADIDDDCPVWPEHWETVLLFISLGTCWRVDGMSGIYFGLDYPAVAVVMTMQGVNKADQAELFNGLQVMERAAMEVLNKKVNKS